MAKDFQTFLKIWHVLEYTVLWTVGWQLQLEMWRNSCISKWSVFDEYMKFSQFISIALMLWL